MLQSTLFPFILAGASALLALPIAVSAGEFSGDATVYGPTLRSAGEASGYNCGYSYLAPSAMRLYTAMNLPQYAGSASCGRCVKASCVSGCGPNARPTTVMVVDKCPECQQGDLDLSSEAFAAITGANPGRVKITWDWAPCGDLVDDSGIKIKTKDGANEFWLALQVNNAAQAVKSMTVQVKGITRELKREEYNYFSASFNDIGGLGGTNINVKVTSTNNEEVSATLSSVTSGAMTETQKQFSGGSVVGPSPTPASFVSPSTPNSPPPAPASTDPPPSASPVPTTTTAASPSTAPSPTTAPPTATPTTQETGQATEDPAITENSDNLLPDKEQGEAEGGRVNAGLEGSIIGESAPSESQGGTDNKAGSPENLDSGSDNGGNGGRIAVVAVLIVGALLVAVAMAFVIYKQHKKREQLLFDSFRSPSEALPSTSESYLVNMTPSHAPEEEYDRKRNVEVVEVDNQRVTIAQV